MLGLKGRQDGFELKLPKDFICKEIEEKYEKILINKHSFYTSPIEFLNESIQKVEVLGFNQGTIQQQQTGTGKPILSPGRINENMFMHTTSEYSYRSEVNPIQLIDKTLNIEFRHSLGYLNYFLLFENFWYMYARDTEYKSMADHFVVNILNENGSIYCRIILYDPIIDGMDMLSFDFTQPIASPQSFKVIFKYSNIDFQFILDDNNEPIDLNYTSE